MVRDTRVVFLCLVVGVLMVASHAQESSKSPNTKSSSASSAGKKASPANDAVVMKVGGVSVTKSEFDSLFAVYEGQGEGAGSEAERKKFAEEYASALMLSQQAVAHHLDSTSEVMHQLALDRTQILSNAEYARLDQLAKPKPEAVSQYYNDHLSDYDFVTLRRIYVWKKNESEHSKGLSDEEARAKGQAIRQALVSGGDAKSLIQGSENTFDAGPMSLARPDVPPLLQKAAFEVKEGEWSEVLDTPDAVVLVQVVKRWRPTLQQVTPGIEKKLKARNLQASLNEIKKTTGVWMDEGYLPPTKSDDSAEQKPSASELQAKDKHQP